MKGSDWLKHEHSGVHKVMAYNVLTVSIRAVFEHTLGTILMTAAKSLSHHFKFPSLMNVRAQLLIAVDDPCRRNRDCYLQGAFIDYPINEDKR